MYLEEKTNNARNAVTSVNLNAGDSFTVSESCLISPSAAAEERIFAFYLGIEETTGFYKGIVDSGWLNTNDLKKFTPVEDYVTDPETYYSVETIGNSIKFTVKQDMSLLINNRKTAAQDIIFNGVYIERAN